MSPPYCYTLNNIFWSEQFLFLRDYVDEVHSLRETRIRWDIKMAIFLGNSCARIGNQVQLSSQFSFASTNSGQNLWPCKDSPLLPRRADTKLRAERITRRRPQEGSDSWLEMDGEEYRGPEGTSSSDTFDANAENVRRRRSNRTSYSRPAIDEEPSSSMRERNNGSENNWWYFERNDRYRNSEWDYESEPPRAEMKSSKGGQWWAADNGDDSYEEDEDEEQEDDWLSWLSVDVKDAFMVLRWGLPAAFLLCTAVIPVMIGNPLILLFGFTIFPTAVKALNPYVKDFLGSSANPFGGSSSTRPKKRSQRTSTYSRGRNDTVNSSDFASPSQPIRGRYDSDVPRYDSDVPKQEVPLQRSSLGGWDDLDEERSRFQAESQWPLQRRGKSGKKLAKREDPLVIRVILAFFPFLRRWGLF